MTSLFKALRLSAVIAAAGIISVSAITPVEAQQTTAELTGAAINAAGLPSAGASIEILHVGSGALWTTTASETGTFRQRGLRPGGPYTVSVVGTNIRQEGVFVNISKPSYVYLASQVPTEEIIVLGTKTQRGIGIGPSTLISESDRTLSGRTRASLLTRRITMRFQSEASIPG